MDSTGRPLPGLEALNRAILDAAGDFVLLLEPRDGGLFIVDANERALAEHGYSRDELVGQPVGVIDPFRSAAEVVEATRTMEAGTTWRFDARHRRKDGSTFEVEVRARVVTLEGRRLLLSVERDVTQRKRTEARLQHMQRLMSYVISHARSAIAVHDRDLNYVYVSDRYLKEYGVTEHDVIGRHHYEVFPDLPQKWREVHQRALRGEVLSAEEDPYERADGTVEWTRWECRPWHEADGTIGGIIVYTEVITDRKRGEDERKSLERQLQQAMKMEAVGRLAGGIAHDFNNLLTGIAGNASLALMDLDPGHPVCEHLGEISRLSDSAAALTRQLLAFWRKQYVEPRPIDLNELIGGLHRMLTRLIGEDVSLQTVQGKALASVRADPGQLEQALVNLAVNARDAMPEGGRLVIETGNVELGEDYCARHAEAKPGRHVMLAVTDTGVGMSEEVKQHLFEPFFTTKGLGRGTGLGLATCFGIVKQAGGSIDVYSEVGHGTAVKIFLPATAEPPQRIEIQKAVREIPTGAETILLVEDDAAVRHLAVRALERAGYTVIEAAQGDVALERAAAAKGRIDLLLTDVVMPGMNGRDLATRLRETHPEARVLFASGYTENVVLSEGSGERVDFIAKPYTPGTLARKVRAVLDRDDAAAAVR